MTEAEEFVQFGTIMHRINPDGTKEHIPREQWDVSYRRVEDEDQQREA